jgi:3-oxo-5alpha-steroid 4-dehydrogenase
MWRLSKSTVSGSCQNKQQIKPIHTLLRTHSQEWIILSTMTARFATDRLRDAREIPHWERTVDVIVVGLGSAGACAALEAHRAGARVLVLEKQAQGGGTSARAAGQLYLGGGTALQTACGFEDTIEDMATYMKMACGPGAPEDKIDLFCRSSIEHYEWLVDQGVPFRPTFVPTTEATNPPGPDGLTYTGSEPAYPWREHARPAPRGHNVQNEGDSGVVLMKVLLDIVEKEGIEVLTDFETERLAIDESGRVIGVGGVRSGERADSQGETWFGADGGVILCTGGFGFNREMLARYAPTLLDCGPVGTEAEDGLGIRLGMAAGGDAVLMGAGCVMIPFSKPRSLVRGIIVNGRGERFINEDVYQAVHGDVALNRQEGVSYLIHDADSYSTPLLPYPNAAEADTIEGLEQLLEMPPGSLASTLERWNDGARRGEDPVFHKAAEWITTLTKPPFVAIDLRRETFPYPFFTLGGLRTDISARVLSPEGEIIPGLFAAGRVSSGLPAQGYNSGMSLSDCTFFGRRAGRCAAGKT